LLPLGGNYYSVSLTSVPTRAITLSSAATAATISNLATSASFAFSGSYFSRRSFAVANAFISLLVNVDFGASSSVFQMRFVLPDSLAMLVPSCWVIALRFFFCALVKLGRVGFIRCPQCRRHPYRIARQPTQLGGPWQRRCTPCRLRRSHISDGS
jgi:hypothetical protein